MSTASAPDTAAVPTLPQPAPRRGFGSLRSMVISMVVVMAAVLSWVAMVPRVREVSQPAADVTSVARQVRQETGWPISQPRLPPGWKATNVRFESAAAGVTSKGTWHAGYLSPDGHYVSIDQTTVAGATDSWVSARTSNGHAEGTLSAAGRTWRKLSSTDIVQRSLLATGSVSKGSASTGSASTGSASTGSASTGSGAAGSGSMGSSSKGSADELTTVLSGTATFAQLAQFAESLEAVPDS